MGNTMSDSPHGKNPASAVHFTITGLEQVHASACAPATYFKMNSGSDAVFLDGLGRVASSGPSAVSKVSFDWSVDLRFSGEVGLCLAPGTGIKAKGATSLLS